MTHKSITVCLFAALLAGCSSANVTKNPGPGDNGIRYYRPKPYLLVTPADATGRMVKLEVKQLPDYNEEYSIHPSGKGTKAPAVALEEGWNLVAVGGPAPPPPPAGAAAAPAAAPGDALKLPEYVMAASNIPIGLYESVFDSSGPGSKYLKGWRYVGFSVWGGGNPNGVDAAGLAAQKAACRGTPPSTPPGQPTGSAISGPLYGIVFFNGAMTFRQIDEVAGNMTCPQYAETIPKVVAPAPPQPTGPGAQAPRSTPAQPGATSPVSPTPNPPSPNPGAASWYAPTRYPLQADAGVTQTSSPTKLPSAKSARSTKASPSAPKSVDPKALESLEAEVFKMLDARASTGENRSTTVNSGYSASTPSTKPASTLSPSVQSTAKVTNGSLVPDLTPVAPMR